MFDTLDSMCSGGFSSRGEASRCPALSVLREDVKMATRRAGCGNSRTRFPPNPTGSTDSPVLSLLARHGSV